MATRFFTVMEIYGFMCLRVKHILLGRRWLALKVHLLNTPDCNRELFGKAILENIKFQCQLNMTVCKKMSGPIVQLSQQLAQK